MCIKQENQWFGKKEQKEKKNEHKEKQPDQAKQVALVTLGSILLLYNQTFLWLVTIQSTT